MTQFTHSIPKQQTRNFILFLVVFDCLSCLANGIIMPGKFDVIRFYNSQESAFSAASSTYLFGGASLYLFLGPISDRYGRRPVMLWGALFFLLMSVLILYAQSMSQFLLLRFFQGTSACFINVVGFVALQEAVEEKQAVKWWAPIATLSLFASISGPLLGGLILHYADWQMIFVLMAGCSLIILWGLWRYMPETLNHRRSRLSLRSIGGHYGRLLKDHHFMLGTLAITLLGLPCFVWIGLAPIMMLQAGKTSLFGFNMWQFPIFGGLILGCLILSKLTHFFRITTLIWVGSILATLGLIGIFIGCWILGNHMNGFIPGLSVYFVGYGIAASPMIRLVLFDTPMKSIAFALSCTITIAIRAIGLQITALLYLNHNMVIYGSNAAITGLCYLAVVWYSLKLYKHSGRQ